MKCNHFKEEECVLYKQNVEKDGINCSQQYTGHCIEETTCNHVTGQCDKGCEARWTGTFC